MSLGTQPLLAEDDQTTSEAVKQLWQAQQKALDAHDLDGVMDTFADTDDIMLMGTGPGEHWVGPEEIKDGKSTEQTLAAAGFRMKIAQTPRQQTKLAGLPQRTLTRTVGPKGNVRFFWADAADCNCLYVGDEAAYDCYQKISVEEQIAEENEMDADMMDWGCLGRLGPRVVGRVPGSARGRSRCGSAPAS